mgnify:CR=1 FL=1
MSDDDLEPLAPADAVEMYVSHRETELSEKSLQNHRYRLDAFVEFCQERGITNLNDLTGRDLHRFRTWRGDGISVMTLRGNLATLRVFLEFCASIDAVEPGMREKVVLPEVDREDESRDVKLDESRAEAILDHLSRFEYASREHVIMAVLWHTGVRLGTLRALDVSDFDAEAPALTVRHRPETGTPLKNGSAAERSIAVGESYAEVIQDYIDHTRLRAEDSHGRAPLISSSQGRLSESSIRLTVYKWTRPCMVADCPHDEDPTTCEYMTREGASQCPSSRSPHGIRRGALTRMLRQGTPEEVVSDRSNVSRDVLEQHYDRRSESERRELRRDFLEDA